MGLKDRGKQPAVTAADVGNAINSGEIQRLYDGPAPAKVSPAR